MADQTLLVLVLHTSFHGWPYKGVFQGGKDLRSGIPAVGCITEINKDRYFVKGVEFNFSLPNLPLLPHTEET